MIFDHEAARREVERRRRTRRSHVPLLSAEDKLRRLEEVERVKELSKLLDRLSPVRKRIEPKVLACIRRRIGNPDWTPSGMLSSGGWAFYGEVEKVMMRIWKRRT